MTLANPSLPRYLRLEQERIEKIARSYGLDFFPVIFEMLSYDQMNEIAAYGGFPNRYPHWRFGMEYERLSKSYEYGLSKIYEMVINNNPSYAYLLEGNSLTDQKLVMCHVFGHVDFFKNNFAFRSTDLDAADRVVDPTSRGGPSYAPNRKWIDKMANHGAAVRRMVDRYGIQRVEEFIDICLSLENLIDPWSRFVVRRHKEDEEEEHPGEVEVPRLRAKDYMEEFINPSEYIEEQKKKLTAEREKAKGKHPRTREQDVLLFLLENAPLERWERAILGIIREEAYYFVPQMQTKIMNEGWASYWHSKMMTNDVCDWSEIVDYSENNAGVMATSGGRLNPYKLGVELFRSIEERWNKGQFGPEWEECDDLDVKKNWDLRLGLGREKIFEVRALYTDVTFIDEFLTEEFAIEHKLF
ncbi:MAG TPA: SpoVR family protein, partial [Polyangiaceae bacterium]|nr:SpoVR family protein [Polyangiaceae bacterium]